MLKAILAVMILATAIATSAEPPPKEKLAPDALKKKFFRCWLETERVDAGETIKDPFELIGLQFAEDGYWLWNRRGELAAGGGLPGIRFDPTTEPMRVDILGRTREVAPSKRESLQVGICQFDGEKLILVVAPWQMLAPPEKGKDYAERPTEFKSTKENKWKLRKLKPAEFYDQD